MTNEHKPVRADSMRCYAKCGCGERFKGPDFAEALSRHLSAVNHTGTVGHYAPLPEQYVTNQEELDANYNDLWAGDDDATGFSGTEDDTMDDGFTEPAGWTEPGLMPNAAGPDDWRPEQGYSEFSASDEIGGYEHYVRPSSGATPEEIAVKREELRITLNGTPREKLQQICSQLNKSAEDVMTRKNEDYAKAEDPFANFRMFGGLGILVRMSDKLARLRQFEERGIFSVTDETLRETCIDLCNYAKLYVAWNEMEGKK